MRVLYLKSKKPNKIVDINRQYVKDNRTNKERKSILWQKENTRDVINKRLCFKINYNRKLTKNINEIKKNTTSICFKLYERKRIRKSSRRISL